MGFIRGCLLFLLTLPYPAAAQTPGYDLASMAQEILMLTNQERQKHRLPPLEYHRKLEKLATLHSNNMLKQGFFAHEDKQGRRASERKDEYFPELLGAVGENIAFIDGVPRSRLARRFVEIWMKSPGHRANILSHDYSHLGIGLARRGRVYYATQVFGDLVAELTSPVASVYKLGSEAELTFEFIGHFPRDKITIFLHFPDKKARFYIDDHEYYTGAGYYRPLWLDEHRFSLKLKLDKGRGTYHLTMGKNGRYTPGGLPLLVR